MSERADFAPDNASSITLLTSSFFPSFNLCTYFGVSGGNSSLTSSNIKLPHTTNANIALNIMPVSNILMHFACAYRGGKYLSPISVSVIFQCRASWWRAFHAFLLLLWQSERWRVFGQAFGPVRFGRGQLLQKSLGVVTYHCDGEFGSFYTETMVEVEVISLLEATTKFDCANRYENRICESWQHFIR